MEKKIRKHAIESMIRQAKEQGVEQLLTLLVTKLAKDSYSAPRAFPEEEFLELDCGEGVMLKLRRIESGSFMMGLQSWHGHQGPVHKVTIHKPFYMGIHLVTQSQYEAVMGWHLSRFGDKPDSRNHPVEWVSWEDAKLFCQKLSKKSSLQVELPSEAQWEYCCGAGSTTKYCFGDDEGRLELYANYNKMQESTLPVGSFLPNEWGLYDMHGNVAEWCADRWHDDYKEAPSDGSAWLTGDDYTNLDHVTRGGSWSSRADLCSTIFRCWMGSFFRSEYIGIRICIVCN